MAMDRFLAASDGSRDGEHAVALGSTLAQRATGHFTRLELNAAACDWEPGHRRWTEVATPGGTATQVPGLPGIEIVRYAETWRADLVVMGRHQHSREHPAQLGPTSDTVIRRRNGPTLFVPTGTSTITRALIALDGTQRGLGILGPAAAVLNIVNARGFALCVLPGPDRMAGDPSPWQDPRAVRARGLVDRLRLDKGACDFLIRWGEPVAAILDMVETTKADLLVIGVRRGGAAGELGTGHVGRDLLRATPCAVLTVPI